MLERVYFKQIVAVIFYGLNIFYKDDEGKVWFMCEPDFVPEPVVALYQDEEGTFITTNPGHEYIFWCE